jgi:hypothetical protein
VPLQGVISEGPSMSIDWERRAETSDFWVGVFPSEEAFFNYVGEHPRYYELVETEEAVPLSLFIRDQGENWFDHDMIEMGYNANADSIAELVQGHSYADQYSDELTRRAAEVGCAKANGFLFIRDDEIAEPRSVAAEDFTFKYVGKITYRI